MYVKKSKQSWVVILLIRVFFNNTDNWNPRWGVRWCGFVQGVDQKLDFYVLTSDTACFQFLQELQLLYVQLPPERHRQNRVSPRLGGTLPPLCHHSNQIHFETCICRSSIVTERKFETLFFTVIMSVFLPALLSVSSLVSTASVHLILWKLKIHIFAVELQSQCEPQGLGKPFGKLFGKVFTLVGYLKPLFVAITLAGQNLPLSFKATVMLSKTNFFFCECRSGILQFINNLRMPLKLWCQTLRFRVIVWKALCHHDINCRIFLSTFNDKTVCRKKIHLFSPSSSLVFNLH